MIVNGECVSVEFWFVDDGVDVNVVAMLMLLLLTIEMGVD